MQLTRTQLNLRQRRTLKRLYQEFEPGVPKAASFVSLSTPRTHNQFHHDGLIFEQLGILVRETRGSQSTWTFPMEYKDALRRLRTYQKDYWDAVGQVISARAKQVKPWTYAYKRQQIVQTTEEVVITEASPIEEEETASALEEQVLVPLVNALQAAIEKIGEMKSTRVKVG